MPSTTTAPAGTGNPDSLPVERQAFELPEPPMQGGEPEPEPTPEQRLKLIEERLADGAYQFRAIAIRMQSTDDHIESMNAKLDINTAFTKKGMDILAKFDSLGTAVDWCHKKLLPLILLVTALIGLFSAAKHAMAAQVQRFWPL